MDIVKDIGKRKWLALIAMSLAAIAFSLDLTVLNLALPTLSSALNASTNQLQWIADSYALMLAVLTLPAGLIGDRYGRKKMMLVALTLFGAASLFCAYSTSVGMLIGARIMLGIGAAFILPLALSVLPVFFSDSERPKAIAVLMGGVFLAYPLGPILGGWLLTYFWWGSVFLINVPIVLIALAAVAILLPESKSSEQHKLDVMGVVISSLGLTGITYGAIQAESRGWNDSLVVASILTGAMLLVLFVAWEKRIIRQNQQPLVDLALFRSADFSWGTILMTFVNFSMFGLFFGLPQYFQSVRGEDALGSGIRLLPMIVGLMIGSIITSKFARKMGAKYAAALGFGTMSIGLILGTRITLSTSDFYTFVWVGIVGLGLGLAVPATADAAIGTLSAERSGAGNALITAIRQVGGTLGIALLGTFLGANYRSQLSLGNLPSRLADKTRDSIVGGVAVAHKLNSIELLHNVRLAFVYGLDIMLLVCAGIAVIAVALALLFLPRRHIIRSSTPGKAFKDVGSA